MNVEEQILAGKIESGALSQIWTGNTLKSNKSLTDGVKAVIFHLQQDWCVKSLKMN